MILIMNSSNARLTTVGVTCATFPMSSSACISRLMRATGKEVLSWQPSVGSGSSALIAGAAANEAA